MNEIFFLILGVFAGGLLMTGVMCCFQINRLNEMEEAVQNENENEAEEVEVIICEVVQ